MLSVSIEMYEGESLEESLLYSSMLYRSKRAGIVDIEGIVLIVRSIEESKLSLMSCSVMLIFVKRFVGVELMSCPFSLRCNCAIVISISSSSERSSNQRFHGKVTCLSSF